MARLITFGCSFAYGLGLPDTIDQKKPPYIYTKPSNYSWAKLLGDMLGRETINKGIPGAGNKEILQNIIATKYEPDDLVIVAWSNFDRYDWYRYNDATTGYHKYPEEDVHTLLEQNFNDEKWAKNNHISNWYIIHHASCYLKSINVQQMHYNIIQVNIYPLPFPDLHITNFVDVPTAEWSVDQCLDGRILPDGSRVGGHPGIESQKLLCKMFYDKIQTL